MRHTSQGRVLYRVRFNGRPDLNSDHFESVKPYRKGDALGRLERAEDGAWQVAEIERAPEGVKDTLICEPTDEA